MKILVTGLCTVHWGRMEYGNIGNFYIIEPLFRELNRVFPEAEIVTTFQMTQPFMEKERVTVLPMEIYYAWDADDVEKAEKEYAAAQDYARCGELKNTTPYMEALKGVGLVIDFSGDMWGDNAEHVGQGRFLVDLLKMRTAQLMGKKAVLFGGTPGPFTDPKTLAFAKEVFRNFSLVVNREPTSSQNMENWGFPMGRVKDFACPAFLYTPELSAAQETEKRGILKGIGMDRPMVGFTIGGFNMPVGPYDLWPRGDSQYDVFAEAVEHIVNTLQARVVLFSHTNGFKTAPSFQLINGRDYPIIKQLQRIVYERGNIKDLSMVACIETPSVPPLMKSVIGDFDAVVTGRVHASVAAISQCVPTVFINYEKRFIPSTKMYGFAQLAGLEEYVCEPKDISALRHKMDSCWKRRGEIHEHLSVRIPEIKELARQAFDTLTNI